MLSKRYTCTWCFSFLLSVRLSWLIFRWASYFLQPQNLWDVGIQGHGHVYRDDETHRFQLGWTWCDCLGSIAVTTDPFSKQGLNGDFLVIFVGWFEGFLCDLLESETWDHFHHLELITGIGSFSFIFICHCGSPALNEPGPFIYSTYIVDSKEVWPWLWRFRWSHIWNMEKPFLSQ